MINDKKFITVYTAYGEPEAHIIKGKLESEGIPVILKYESAGPVIGIIVDGLGQVQVQVPEDMVTAAKEMLEVRD